MAELTGYGKDAIATLMAVIAVVKKEFPGSSPQEQRDMICGLVTISLDPIK